MVFQAAINSLASILRRSTWAGELAGILPLSALIDFIEIPPKLHILELAGAVPFWSWVITPAGSRLLLAKPKKLASRDCYQDRFGNTTALEVLDGRYGERYFAKNPETLRLVLGAYPIIEVENNHKNMASQGADLRIQNLEVVYVSRRNHNVKSGSSRPLWRQVLVDPWRITSPLYLATTLLGWILFIGSVIMSAFFQTWISFAFLLLIPVTGMVVFCLYGSQPRRLLVEKKSEYIRLLLVTEHMNSADWLVIYGESTIVNSLLNRPLEPDGLSLSPAMTMVFRFLLRLMILGQWGLVLGAAATKDWNSYFVCFWISFSIFSQAYLITPQRGAKAWSELQANLKLQRYGTRVSTRRTMINTIVALNPDTFSFDEEAKVPNMTEFNNEGMKWVDPILTPSNNRTMWEEATLKAMVEDQQQLAASDPDSFPSPGWNAKYADPKTCYWREFIPEGIYIATKIKKAAKLPNRKTTETTGSRSPR